MITRVAVIKRWLNDWCVQISTAICNTSVPQQRPAPVSSSAAANISSPAPATTATATTPRPPQPATPAHRRNIIVQQSSAQETQAVHEIPDDGTRTRVRRQLVHHSPKALGNRLPSASLRASGKSLVPEPAHETEEADRESEANELGRRWRIVDVGRRWRRRRRWWWRLRRRRWRPSMRRFGKSSAERSARRWLL